MGRKWGKILPGGNKAQFHGIEGMLRSLGVSYLRHELPTGGAVFVFDESELAKLPRDDKGPYLPTSEESGHSIYELDDASAHGHPFG